jgi:hypothetical protein
MNTSRRSTVAGVAEGARLPLAGDRVEYRNGHGSPLYAGTVTGKPCSDPTCSCVHVIVDGRSEVDLHHVPRGFFAAGEHRSKWARVIARKGPPT